MSLPSRGASPTRRSCPATRITGGSPASNSKSLACRSTTTPSHGSSPAPLLGGRTVPTWLSSSARRSRSSKVCISSSHHTNLSARSESESFASRSWPRTGSLCAKGFDGIDTGRAPGRHGRRKERGDQERDDRHRQRDRIGPRYAEERTLRGVARQERNRTADDDPEEDEHQRLTKDQPSHIPG